MSTTSSQSTEKRHMSPYVHYHCSCPDLVKNDNDKKEATEHCHQIRCPRCVQEEIVCYYCPNCLFEVPTASVKSERNRCARNCFQCPICQNTLSIVASTESTPSSLTSSTALITSADSTTISPETISGAPYYFSCGVCRWDSQEIGMTFEKATGLASQLQKAEDERPDVKEFDHLKEHFEKHLRHTTPAATLPTSITGIGNFSSRYGGVAIPGGLSHTQQKSDDLAPYEAAIRVENESVLVDDLVQLKDINQITTLMQRMNQLSDQPYKVDHLQPQRTHLRTKRVKRCRQCRHILIKPEQKAQSTRFKIKLIALAYIPKITIMSLPKLILNQTTQIILKFSNPLYEEAILDLDVQDVEFGKIKVLAPHFSIAPYNEVWEYDEQDSIPSKSRSQISGTPKSDIGIYERRSNSTSIILEITPEAEVEEFKFALLVTCTSKITDDDNIESSILSTNATKAIMPDSKSDDNVDTKTEDNSNEKLKVDSSLSFNEDNQVTKSLSFWVVIGLGSVVNTRHTITGIALLPGEKIEFIDKTNAIKLSKETSNGFIECGYDDEFCGQKDIVNESIVLITNYRTCYHPIRNHSDNLSLTSLTTESTSIISLTIQIPHLSVSSLEESQSQITISLKFFPFRYLFTFPRSNSTKFSGNTVNQYLCVEFGSILKENVNTVVLEDVFAFRMGESYISQSNDFDHNNNSGLAGKTTRNKNDNNKNKTIKRRKNHDKILSELFSELSNDNNDYDVDEDDNDGMEHENQLACKGINEEIFQCYKKLGWTSGYQIEKEFKRLKLDNESW
ncbi:19787_t:CDS:10 [Entrophospora sp. SA101]|nr:19787_t:CDS:10 [Entrophospora sp. SA101]